MIEFRDVNRENAAELAFIADRDSRVPVDYDSEYRVTEESVRERTEFYKRAVKPTDFFMVAHEESAIIGFHVILKRPHPPGIFAGDIITLWVDPKFRGKGIASELKTRGETWARASDITYLFTGVHPSNTAMMSLNERKGFSVNQINLRKNLKTQL